MKIHNISNATIEQAKDIVATIFEDRKGGIENFAHDLQKWYVTHKSEPYGLRLAVIACAIVTGGDERDAYYCKPTTMAVRQMLPKVEHALKHHERLVLVVVDNWLYMRVYSLFTRPLQYWGDFPLDEYAVLEENITYWNLYRIDAHIDPIVEPNQI